jgi:hypothetical protein
MILVKILVILVLFKISNSKCDIAKYKIGLIYDEANRRNVDKFIKYYHNENSFFEFEQLELLQTQTEYYNPVSISLNLCNKFFGNSSTYSIVSLFKHKNSIESTQSIGYLGSYYQIPVISMNARDAIFSDKTIYKSFIRITPPYYNEAKIWIDLIRKFKWTSVNFIHSTDNEGTFLANRFQYYADQADVKVIINY